MESESVNPIVGVWAIVIVSAVAWLGSSWFIVYSLSLPKAAGAC